MKQMKNTGKECAFSIFEQIEERLPSVSSLRCLFFKKTNYQRRNFMYCIVRLLQVKFNADYKLLKWYSEKSAKWMKHVLGS